MTTIDHTLQYVYYSEGNSLVSDRYADEWDIAVLLPMESFVGAPKNKVFAESEDKF
jgi:hypothetical protein